MRRVSAVGDVRLVNDYSNVRQAALKTNGAFEILSDRKALQRILGEAHEKGLVIGKAESDFYYVIARSLTSTRDDIGQIPRPNGNGDTFIHSELCRINQESRKPNLQSFVGKGVFTNHQSDKVECCFGTQLATRFAFADKPIGIADTCAHNLLAIDKAKAAELGIFDGIRSGYLNTWSMGCDIEAAVCSVCGNVIQKDTDPRCDHIVAHRGAEMISDTDMFPQWQGKKVRVADILIGPKFVEISSVTVPADYTAETQDVIGEISDMRPREAASIDLSPYSQPELSQNTVRMADIEPNGDGTYTAVINTETKATFADHQTALDFIQSAEKKASQYDHPANYEYDDEPAYRQSEDQDEPSSEEKNTENEIQTASLGHRPKILLRNSSKGKRRGGLSQLLDL